MGIDVVPEMEVDRTKPHPELDGTDVDPRLTRYREQAVVNYIFTKHPLADEGSYFVCQNNQTGIATAAAPTAFSATNPFLLIYNGGNASDDFAPRLYIDYIMLLVTAAGTAGTSVQFAITKDVGNRYTSGGTDLTSNIANCGPTSQGTLVRAYAGNITASAASANVKTMTGNRVFKTMTAPAPTIGDEYTARFGAANIVESMQYLNNATTLTSNLNNTKNLVPVVIGPNESFLFHLWLPAQSAASSYAPEFGWWER